MIPNLMTKMNSRSKRNKMVYRARELYDVMSPLQSVGRKYVYLKRVNVPHGLGRTYSFTLNSKTRD